MMRLFLAMFGIWIGSAALADEKPARSSAKWQGSIAFGAELDERDIPAEEKAAPAKPARVRIGFAANWSFSLHWERVEDGANDGQDAKSLDSEKLSADEAKVIELTNAERKKNKLPELKADPVLMKVAREHSATMARLDQVGHELEGKSFSKRMNQADYHASKAGENVAQGARDPAEAVSDWMMSSGHQANIMQSEYSRIGVGTATSKSGKTYWTQVFAKPFNGNP